MLRTTCFKNHAFINVRHYSICECSLAQFIERAIRSLKTLIYRMMEEDKSRNWPEAVPRAIKIMNERKHAATGLPPNAVDADNSGIVFRRLHPEVAQNIQPPHALKPKFKIGDKVRTILPSSVLSKKTSIKNSEEVFKISRILFHPTIRYKLGVISNSELITGSYNESELIPVT